MLLNSTVILLIIAFSIGIIGLLIARVWLWSVMNEERAPPPPRRTIPAPRRRSPAMPTFAHSPAASTVVPDEDIELGDITNHSRASSTLAGSFIDIGPQLPPGLHVDSSTSAPEDTMGTDAASREDHRETAVQGSEDE